LGNSSESPRTCTHCRRTFSINWEGLATRPTLNPALIRTMLQPRSLPKPPEGTTRNQRRTNEAEREAGLKDSGHFFPGIGGILDLLDSLLFNAPIMYLCLRHVLTNYVKGF
jgi:hypothetical protein